SNGPSTRTRFGGRLGRSWAGARARRGWRANGAAAGPDGPAAGRAYRASRRARHGLWQWPPTNAKLVAVEPTTRFTSRASCTTGTRLFAAAMLIAVGLVIGVLHGAMPS